MVVTFAVTVLGVREPAIVDLTGERLGLRRYLAELTEHRQAMRYLAAIFVFMVGFSAVLPYLTLFITVDIGESEQVALALAAGTLLVTAISAVAFGKVADRIGTKPVLLTGWALLAIAAFGGTVIQHLPETIAIVLLAGVGNGAATAAGWPLLASLVPPEKTGVFAGLKAAAESVAIPASVVVAAELFLPRFSYRGVFVLLAGAILVALFILARYVRPPAQFERPPVAGVGPSV
jgi:MFS-type transporter involved in bile tolerance (Atg22 family)